jgi:hypothetical protein
MLFTRMVHFVLGGPFYSVAMFFNMYDFVSLHSSTPRRFSVSSVGAPASRAVPLNLP